MIIVCAARQHEHWNGHIDLNDRERRQRFWILGCFVHSRSWTIYYRLYIMPYGMERNGMKKKGWFLCYHSNRICRMGEKSNYVKMSVNAEIWSPSGVWLQINHKSRIKSFDTGMKSSTYSTRWNRFSAFCACVVIRFYSYVCMFCRKFIFSNLMVVNRRPEGKGNRKTLLFLQAEFDQTKWCFLTHHIKVER